MAGPLAEVDTLVAGINLDVNRQLRLGVDATLEFLKSKAGAVDGWEIVKTLIDNFDRISGDESDRGDAKQVVFQACELSADGTANNLATVLRTTGLYVRCNGNIYTLERSAQPADNEAQVYTIYCKTRTMNNKYFDETRR